MGDELVLCENGGVVYEVESMRWNLWGRIYEVESMRWNLWGGIYEVLSMSTMWPRHGHQYVKIAVALDQISAVLKWHRSGTSWAPLPDRPCVIHGCEGGGRRPQSECLGLPRGHSDIPVCDQKHAWPVLVVSVRCSVLDHWLFWSAVLANWSCRSSPVAWVTRVTRYGVKGSLLTPTAGTVVTRMLDPLLGKT